MQAQPNWNSSWRNRHRYRIYCATAKPLLKLDYRLQNELLRYLLENSCGTADRMLGGGDAKYMWCQDVGLSEIANNIGDQMDSVAGLSR